MKSRSSEAQAAAKPQGDNLAPAGRSQAAELLARRSLPLDLGEWVAPHLILAWTIEETSKLDGSDPRLVDRSGAEPGPRPRTLVSLLGYAYLTGLFDAEGIVRACHTNPSLRAFCAEGAPFPQDLIKFRRHSRTLLLPVLLHLLKRAFGERFRLDPSTHDPALERLLQENAASRLDIARHMDRSEEA